jgi:hypothetical protein
MPGCRLARPWRLFLSRTPYYRKMIIFGRVYFHPIPPSRRVGGRDYLLPDCVRSLARNLALKESAMFKRTLIFGAALFVLVSAVIICLAILDILSFQEVIPSLRKFLAVVAVSAVAIILIHKLLGLARQESSDKHSRAPKIPGPAPPGEKSDSE